MVFLTTSITGKEVQGCAILTKDAFVSRSNSFGVSFFRTEIYPSPTFLRRRLGDDDHIIRWFKPTSIRSLDWKSYTSLPEYITVRETKIRVTQPGFRTKSFVVVTTLMDAQKSTKEDLATLYRARWNNELDLRSIKSTMQMRELRCKTPEMVRKEVWTHILAYNLIRTLMA
jgi:IS4 transposase